MEACQSFDKKHEPETSYYTNFDVKHEDHTQTKPTVYAPEFRPVMGSNSDISDQSTSYCQQQNINTEEKCMFKRNKFFENTDAHRKDNFDVPQIPQSNRNYWNNHTKKLSCERTCYTNDSSRQFTRTVQKQKKELHKKMPTPRSNVHTAYTPIMQSLTWNSMLDPNGFTIQLLRYGTRSSKRNGIFFHILIPISQTCSITLCSGIDAGIKFIDCTTKYSNDNSNTLLRRFK